MTASSPSPPPQPPAPAAPHSTAHEDRILSIAFGDPDADDPQAAAEMLADCDECLSRTLRILDELFALHAAGGRPAPATPPAAIARLDALLDDAMVLRGQRAAAPPPAAGDPGTGQKAEHERDRAEIPLGPGRR